ncbi:MAG TPA: hypothetical protein VKW08_25310 [Xanthobacteraceae bacterium]|jgi:hypothetical protein|nr:hypothetical protein [Xanthobacteraceae bacterium]
MPEAGSARARGVSLVVCAAGLAGLAAVAGAAVAVPSSKIPQLTSADFGWQSNVADWQEPPPGSGHGPIKPDPEHPYTSNAVGGRTGTQPTKRLGDYRDPVLKPWAAAEMKASNDEALSSVEKIPFAAQARCYPGGVPGQLLFPFEPIYFIQLPNIVYMIWQRDHMVRRVFMTDKHSENIKPSWFGESIGHYENGDTLVIDTIGLSTKDSYIDNFRTPHTDKLHVVERLQLEADGTHLTGIARVEDPDTFNAPLTMKQRWTKTKGRMIETVCAENNNDYFSQGLFPVPMAAKPDF